MENNNLKGYRQTADLVKRECIKTALEAYETASQSGVCHEGAWECAIDAMKSLDIEELLTSLLGSKGKI